MFTTALNLPSLLGAENMEMMIHKQRLKEPTRLIAVKIPQPRQGQQTENKKSKKPQIQLKKPKLLSRKSPHY